MNEIKVKWVNNLVLEGSAEHKNIYFDSRHKDKTELNGSSPTNVFLLSIIGCSTMSSVAALHRNDVMFKGVETFIDTDTESNIDNPYHFTRFRIKYIFQEVDKEQEESLIESVKVSHQKYCPMVFMAEQIAPVQYEILNNDTLIHKSENWIEKNIPECDSEICEKYYAY